MYHDTYDKTRQEFVDFLLQKDYNISSEENLYAEIVDYKIPIVPEDLRFWMVRTKKGYFYHEFIRSKFVALAWNLIDVTTDFSKDNVEFLKDSIILEYPDIKRATTVVNKCNLFINEIEEGDIILIPSAKSQYITIALAGKYFEVPEKNINIEKAVISRIEENIVTLNDVSCPYKKRRQIIPLRTVKSEDLSPILLRALSNYHGVSNLDTYAKFILNQLLNCYTLNNDINIVLNVKTTAPIRPRELGQIMYGTVDYFMNIIPEDSISTQLSLNSPGDIVIHLKDVFNFIKDHYLYIVGAFVLIGGGSFLSVELPGIPAIIQNLFAIPENIKQKKLDTELKELEVTAKKLELSEKLKASEINPDALKKPLDCILNSAEALQIEPIKLNDEATIDQYVESIPEDDIEDDL